MHAGSIPYAGRAFVYALCLEGQEDLLKVGMSREPLARWSAFHPRWFEAFDLDHSLLVEGETRADAQALETALHRRLVAHGCPMPLAMRDFADGKTEWYRGASDAARGFAAECAAGGHVVHAQARTHAAVAMQARRHVLVTVLDQAAREHRDDLLSPAQRVAVRDLADAHRAFGDDLADLLDADARTLLDLLA